MTSIEPYLVFALGPSGGIFTMTNENGFAAKNTQAKLDAYRQQVGNENAARVGRELQTYLKKWQCKLRQSGNDIDAQRKLAHKLRGTSGLWSHPALEKLLDQLKNESGDELKNQILACIDELIEAIDRYIDTL